MALIIIDKHVILSLQQSELGQLAMKDQYYPRDILPSFLLILVVSVLGYFHLIPVFPQMIVISCCCVFIGSVLGSKIVKSLPKSHNKNALMQTRQAILIPALAFITIFVLYILYSYVETNLLNSIILLAFSVGTIPSTAQLILKEIKVSPQYSRKIMEIKMFSIEFSLSLAQLLMNLVCGVVVLCFAVTKNWVLNNMMGIFFTISAIRSIELASFRVGLILLWLLFVYDIAMVYATSIMVTVAKNLTLPVKLQFPYIQDNQQQFSILGLGDMVVPGIFIAYCLKHDVDMFLKTKPKILQNIPQGYFLTCFCGYISGIALTYLALKVFNHAQPALLFIVPCCTIPIAIKIYQEKKRERALSFRPEIDDEIISMVKI